MTAKFFTFDNVTTSFDRGFTLHEHYDDFGLINMNGCLYNPFAGKEPTAFYFPNFPKIPKFLQWGKSFLKPRLDGSCSILRFV